MARYLPSRSPGCSGKRREDGGAKGASALHCTGSLFLVVRVVTFLFSRTLGWLSADPYPASVPGPAQSGSLAACCCCPLSAVSVRSPPFRLSSTAPPPQLHAAGAVAAASNTATQQHSNIASSPPPSGIVSVAAGRTWVLCNAAQALSSLSPNPNPPRTPNPAVAVLKFCPQCLTAHYPLLTTHHHPSAALLISNPLSTPPS